MNTDGRVTNSIAVRAFFLHLLLLPAVALGTDAWYWDSEISNSRSLSGGVSSAPIVLSSETPSGACENDQLIQWSGSNRWVCVDLSGLPTVSDHAGQLVDYGERLTTHRQDIDGVDVRVSALENSLGGIHNDLTEHGAWIDSQDATVRALEQRVSNNESGLIDADDRLAALEQQVDDLQRQLEGFEGGSDSSFSRCRMALEHRRHGSGGLGGGNSDTSTTTPWHDGTSGMLWSGRTNRVSMSGSNPEFSTRIGIQCE